MVPLPGGASQEAAGVTRLSDGTICLQAVCPCGRVIRTSLDNAGKAARCPECGEVVPLPAIRKKGSREETAGKSSGRAAAAPKNAGDDFLAGGEEEQLDWDSLPEPEERSAKPKRRKKPVEEEESDEDEEELESRPRKKKKSRSKSSDDDEEEDDEGSSKKWLILGGVGAFVVTAGLVALMVAFMSKVPVTDDKAGQLPKDLEFVDFNHENVRVHCVYPKGWEARGAGGQGNVPPVAIFEDGTARVEFRSNLRGSAMTMNTQASRDPNVKVPDEFKPVSQIHEMHLERYKEDISGYKEIGSPTMVKVTGFGGEGRLSNYTANAGLFGTVRGYRVTLIGSDQWNCFFQCPAGDWKKYQPIFDKMLASASGG